jgi:hypothetical protein
MTAQIIAQLTTSVVSIVGVVTTSIITIRAHSNTAQAIIAATVPATATQSNVRVIPSVEAQQ